jgi:hypothetical protein
LIQINVPARRRAGENRSRLIYVKADRPRARQASPMWQHIATAPFDSNLEIAVIDGDGPHALVFPCRRILGGWMNAETKERLEVHPTHWRRWEDRASGGTAA